MNFGFHTLCWLFVTLVALWFAVSCWTRWTERTPARRDANELGWCVLWSLVTFIAFVISMVAVQLPA